MPSLIIRIEEGIIAICPDCKAAGHHPIIGHIPEEIINTSSAFAHLSVLLDHAEFLGHEIQVYSDIDNNKFFGTICPTHKPADHDTVEPIKKHLA